MNGANETRWKLTCPWCLQIFRISATSAEQALQKLALYHVCPEPKGAA